MDFNNIPYEENIEINNPVIFMQPIRYKYLKTINSDILNLAGEKVAYMISHKNGATTVYYEGEKVFDAVDMLEAFWFMNKLYKKEIISKLNTFTTLEIPKEKVIEMYKGLLNQSTEGKSYEDIKREILILHEKEVLEIES